MATGRRAACRLCGRKTLGPPGAFLCSFGWDESGAVSGPPAALAAPSPLATRPATGAASPSPATFSAAGRGLLDIGYQITGGQLQGQVEVAYRTDSTQVMGSTKKPAAIRQRAVQLQLPCPRPSVLGTTTRTSLAHTGAQSPHVDVGPCAAAIDVIPAAAGNTPGAPFGCVLLLPARVGCEIAMRPPGAAPASGYDTGFNSSRSVLKSRNSILSRHSQWSRGPGGAGFLAKARQARSYCVSVVVECRRRGRCALT